MYTFWYAVFCSRCSAAFSWNGPCDWSISPESIYLSNCEGTLEFRCSRCFCMFSRLCSNSSSCFEFEQTGNTARKIFCDRRAQLSQNCLVEITLCTLFTPVTIETPRRHALEKKEKSNCINISSFSHCTWKMKPRQMCQKLQRPFETGFKKESVPIDSCDQMSNSTTLKACLEPGTKQL